MPESPEELYTAVFEAASNDESPSFDQWVINGVSVYFSVQSGGRIWLSLQREGVYGTISYGFIIHVANQPIGDADVDFTVESVEEFTNVVTDCIEMTRTATGEKD